MDTIATEMWVFFFGLSWKFFNYNFQIDEAADFIFSERFYHLPINVPVKFFVYWLNITEDIEPYRCT